MVLITTASAPKMYHHILVVTISTSILYRLLCCFCCFCVLRNPNPLWATLHNITQHYTTLHKVLCLRFVCALFVLCYHKGCPFSRAFCFANSRFHGVAHFSGDFFSALLPKRAAYACLTALPQPRMGNGCRMTRGAHESYIRAAKSIAFRVSI